MSLLASNVYALLFSVFLFHQSLQWFYFLGFAFVAAGILLYSYQPKKEEESMLTVDLSNIA